MASGSGLGRQRPRKYQYCIVSLLLLEALYESFEVALHPKIQHGLDALGALTHDLQKLGMLLAHHFLQLQAIIPPFAKLLRSPLDVTNRIIDILSNI